MPGLDGKGPRGQGKMTGGGRGYCVVDIESEYLGLGRLGLGRKMGRGRGNCFRTLRASGQNESSPLTELQAKFNRLQADFEAIKAKSE